DPGRRLRARRGRPAGLGGRGAHGRADRLLHVALCVPDLLRRAALAGGPPPPPVPGGHDPAPGRARVPGPGGRAPPPHPPRGGGARINTSLERGRGGPAEYESTAAALALSAVATGMAAVGAVVAWLLYIRPFDWLALGPPHPPGG